MEKYIAYEKLSKKEKKRVNNSKRKTWGSINPITRKPTNSKAYNRKKNQYWKDELRGTDSFLFYSFVFFDVPVNDSFKFVNGLIKCWIYGFGAVHSNQSV